MTNELSQSTTPDPTRHIEIEDAPPLEALVSMARAGLTIVLSSAGVPIARLQPIEPIQDDQFLAAEPAAAYTSQEPTPALARVLGGAAARSVFGVFVRQPDRPIHQREVARRAGVGLRSAQLALERLESLGLVASERDGNRRSYRAIRSDGFEELRRLLAPEFGIAGAVRRALAPFAESIRWAFIYGSIAKGTDRIGSDVDVLVVGDVRRTDLDVATAELEEQLGRPIAVTLYRPTQYRERVSSKNHFVTAVLEGPRIDVIGGADDA